MLYDPKWETQTDETAPREPWRDLLMQAANVIRQRGLAKGTQEDELGRVCLHGAINVALTGTSFDDDDDDDPDCASSRACRAVYEYLRLQGVSEALTSPGGSAYWNNRPERTKDEVIAALENAAKI